MLKRLISAVFSAKTHFYQQTYPQL